MKGLELLSLTDEQKKLLEASELNYKKFARIYFSVISADNNGIVVKIWQKENPAGKYLSSKELIDRAKDVFKGMVNHVKIHVRPIPYKKNDLSEYTIQDIQRDMEDIGLQAKDLVKLLNIDKSSISSMLNQGRELTKSHKAMFYYLFKYLKCK